MKDNKMKKEIVYSNIEYKGKDAKNADFWQKCYHPDDMTPELFANGKQWHKYTISFEELTPFHITKREKV